MRLDPCSLGALSLVLGKCQGKKARNSGMSPRDFSSGHRSPGSPPLLDVQLEAPRRPGRDLQSMPCLMAASWSVSPGQGA